MTTTVSYLSRGRHLRNGLSYEIYKSHDLKLIYDLCMLINDIIFDLILLRFKDNMCSWYTINSVSVGVISVSLGTTGDKAL